MARTTGRIGKKKTIDRSVIDCARERVAIAFERFDKVVVMFSGGKDSTVALNLVLEEAKRLGRGPVDVIFFDEEAIYPTTIEYVKRVAARPDVRMHWYCLPVMHRNACSRKQPWWYCWHPDEKDLWVRDLPEGAITDHPKFEMGMTIPDISDKLFGPEHGKVIKIMGIRADESMRRQRIVSMRAKDNWYSLNSKEKNNYNGYPIYDFSTSDIWTAIGTFGWDHDKTYDVFDKAGMPRSKQRVCPPFGEEPLRGLWIYAECFPDMWHKMLNRVHGVNTAWRYANTDLYSVNIKETPGGIPFEEYSKMILSYYPPDIRKKITKNVNSLIKRHNKQSIRKIPDFEPDPISGISWRFICKVIICGDMKGRKSQGMQEEAGKSLKKMGMTMDDAIELFGVDNTRFG